uniref:Uncharacterized protein n=1 Tax=Anguilla anguilla TaxID=7936 RepID=A0A0E9PW21_ANGAN
MHAAAMNIILYTGVGTAL